MANLVLNRDHGFKIGDVVVSLGTYGRLIKGEKYIISNDKGRGDVPGYVQVEGRDAGYYPGRFELVKKVEVEPIKWKVIGPEVLAEAGDVVVPREFDGMAPGAPGFHEHMRKLLGVPIEAKELNYGFKGRPWLLVGGYFWPIEALDVVKDGKVIKDARKAIAKKPKVKKPRKLALRSQLASKVKESAGVCSYIMEYKDGSRREQVRDVCHARFWGGSADTPCTAAALNMSGHLKGHDDAWKKGFSKFLNYMMNRSPLASTFKTKKASEALKAGIYMNVQENHNLVVMAAVGIRQATEYRGFIPAFMFGLSKGFSEHASWIMANLCHLTDGQWSERIGGGHQITSGEINIPQMIEKFHTSFGNLRGKAPFATNSGYKLIANWDGKANYAGEYAYGGRDERGEGTITHLFTKTIPMERDGKGWDAKIRLTDGVVIKRLQYFENLLKQVKE